MHNCLTLALKLLEIQLRLRAIFCAAYKPYLHVNVSVNIISVTCLNLSLKHKSKKRHKTSRTCNSFTHPRI